MQYRPWTTANAPRASGNPRASFRARNIYILPQTGSGARIPGRMLRSPLRELGRKKKMYSRPHPFFLRCCQKFLGTSAYSGVFDLSEYFWKQRIERRFSNAIGWRQSGRFGCVTWRTWRHMQIDKTRRFDWTRALSRHWMWSGWPGLKRFTYEGFGGQRLGPLILPNVLLMTKEYAMSEP